MCHRGRQFVVAAQLRSDLDRQACPLRHRKRSAGANAPVLEEQALRYGFVEGHRLGYVGL
jgi:hypothetical protein